MGEGTALTSVLYTKGCEQASHWGLQSMFFLLGAAVSTNEKTPVLGIKKTWVPVQGLVISCDPVKHHLFQLGCHQLYSHKGKVILCLRPEKGRGLE